MDMKMRIMKIKMNMNMKMEMNMDMKMKIKTMIKQWFKKKKIIIIKEENYISDKIIDKSKPFEEQIESLKKIEDLQRYCSYKDYDDKELKPKYFQIKLTDMSKEIDKKKFKQIFGHTLIKLVDKLINTTEKEENQIIVKNINANKKET